MYYKAKYFLCSKVMGFLLILPLHNVIYYSPYIPVFMLHRNFQRLSLDPDITKEATTLLFLENTLTFISILHFYELVSQKGIRDVVCLS